MILETIRDLKMVTTP